MAVSRGTLKMDWDDHGFLVPFKYGTEPPPEDSVAACPFTTSAASEKDEDRIATTYLSDAPKFDKYIGRFQDTYIGHSIEHRLASSSGGLATYILEQMIERGIVKYAFLVEANGADFRYRLVDSVSGVRRSSKTRYYPVTLASFFEIANELDGPVAVTGVACFVKAIRIRQTQDPIFASKVKFIVGIICGGLKSRFFTDYLASSAGAEGPYFNPQYRVKDRSSTASDYSFSAESNDGTTHFVKMKSLGDMWGTGMFKAKACDFCTDVLTELADISLGDAWLPEFRNDGAGNSVVVTRTAMADMIIREGIQSGRLAVANVEPVRIADSQRASFAHRWNGLGFRVKWAELFKTPLPNVRPRTISKTSLPFALVQILRNVTRSESLRVWKETKDLRSFTRRIRIYQRALKTLTKINHIVRRL